MIENITASGLAHGRDRRRPRPRSRRPCGLKARPRPTRASHQEHSHELVHDLHRASLRRRRGESREEPGDQSNPDAAAAAADAKKQAQTVATAATSATAAALADAQTATDPVLTVLTGGLTTAIDGFATAAFGPVGGEIAAEVAGPLLTLGEEKAVTFVSRPCSRTCAPKWPPRPRPAPAERRRASLTLQALTLRRGGLRRPR